MKRRKTRTIRIGDVEIGGGSAVSIQSMTNTDTTDIIATVRQIRRLQQGGCEVIRVAAKDIASAQAIQKIRRNITIPLEADIHFDYRIALTAIASGADGIRLNPGNINRPTQVREVVAAAKKKRIPIRIGVNTGSLPRSPRRLQDSSRGTRQMVKVVLNYLKIFEKEKFYDIMVSLKASDVKATIEAYREMARYCNYPFLLGVTATGTGTEGIVKSAIGIGTLLAEGIGDTIRVSLTADPIEEVIAARQILQALGLRRFGHEIRSCPTCGRCQVDLIKMVKTMKHKLSTLNPQPSTRRFYNIAIMGCEVNGPGEAQEADIGIAFGKGSGVIFEQGKIVKKVRAGDAVKELLTYINHKPASRQAGIKN